MQLTVLSSPWHKGEKMWQKSANIILLFDFLLVPDLNKCKKNASSVPKIEVGFCICHTCQYNEVQRMSHRYCIRFQYAFIMLHHEKNVPWPSIINLLCPNVACTTALGPHWQMYTGHRYQLPHFVHGMPAVSLSSYIHEEGDASSIQNI